jgi:hypothetical protein
MINLMIFLKDLKQISLKKKTNLNGSVPSYLAEETEEELIRLLGLSERTALLRNFKVLGK